MYVVWLTVLFIAAAVLPAQADRLTLTTPEPVNSPTAVRVEFDHFLFSVENAKLLVRYRFLDAANRPLLSNDGAGGWKIWECRDVPIPGDNDECTDGGEPFECCTGAGTGTCNGLAESCFSDIVRFQIRAQDVGTRIGIGLRQLIWNKMRQEVTNNNNGTFEQE